MDSIALNLSRFHELAGAFGGDLRRWPAAERAQASALLAADPVATQPILARAAALDELLAASPDPVPSLALREAIVAFAPRPRRVSSTRRWVGVGLAAASVAGVLAGSAAAPIASSRLHWQTADTASEAARLLGEPSDLSEG